MTNLLYLNKGYNISMKREPEEEIITIPWQITLQYYRPLASGKRQTANRSYAFAVSRCRDFKP